MVSIQFLARLHPSLRMASCEGHLLLGKVLKKGVSRGIIDCLCITIVLTLMAMGLITKLQVTMNYFLDEWGFSVLPLLMGCSHCCIFTGIKCDLVHRRF